MNFLELLGIEFTKVKRSRIVPLIFVAPLLVVASGIVNLSAYFTPEYTNAWPAMFIQSALVYAYYLLPLATLVPVFTKATLPDGVRSVWAIVNIASALAGLMLSVICVKSEESRSAINITSTIVSVSLALMMLGMIALVLVMRFLQ